MKGKNGPKPRLCAHCCSCANLGVNSHSSGWRDGGFFRLFGSPVAIFQVDPKFLSPSFGKGAHLYLRQHPGIALSPDGAADEWEDTLPSGRQVV